MLGNTKKWFLMVLSVLLALFFVCQPLYAQKTLRQTPRDFDPSQKRLDSILTLITPDLPDSVKARLYLEVARSTYKSDTAIKYANKILEYCPEDDYYYVAYANRLLGMGYFLKHDLTTAINYYRTSGSLFQLNGDYVNEIWCYMMLSQSYEGLGVVDSTFYYLNKSLKLSIDHNDSTQMAYSYVNLGRVSINQTLYHNAEEYINKAVELDSLTNNIHDLAIDYYWLGCLYIKAAVYSKTGHYLKKSIAILEKLEKDRFMYRYYVSTLYLDYAYLADAYITSAEMTDTARYADSCYYYLQKCGDFFLKQQQYSNYMVERFAYVKYLMFLKKYKQALQVLKDCEQYPTSNDLLRDYHMYLSAVYEKLGSYKDAFEHQKLQYKYAMEFVNDSTITAVSDIKTIQALLLKDEEQKRLYERHQSETHRMQIIISALTLVLILATLLVIFIYRLLKIRKKAFGILSQKNKILDQQKHEIQSQRDELTHVHNAVIDSMRYSERIQRAVIPSDEFIKSLFPQSFVYYRPREIVSGDFYYASKCGKYNVCVVADCTGHGIPGGFLSMLGITSLKEFLVTDEDAANPGRVLDSLRTFVKEALGFSGDNLMPLYDGMDMIICSFDFENMKLHYASANFKSNIVRKGDVIKLMGDKFPVGRYFVENDHFTTYTIDLMPGDMVYLYSDGIQDQPGGDFNIPEGKKLMWKNFMKILVGIANDPVEQQYKFIGETINFWINGREQVDDMTLVGIKI